MEKQGFSTEERLLKTFQFKSVYQQGRPRKSAILWIYSIANGLGKNRLGISVSNKSCKNIVQRNKIKRIIREVYRLNKDVFGQSRDVVVVLKRAPKEINYVVFEKVLKECLNCQERTTRQRVI
ncbi:MAG: ribonuclease P protein component [PVC group bacterium]|nr:ribonuclease P protein component [PVC group bacterium]